MIQGPTLFILGAGASVPYGYPTGEELKSHIIQNFPRQLASYYSRFNDDIYTAIWKNQVLEMVNALNGAIGITIDEFLTTRPEFADLGKIAILLAMFRFENISHNTERNIRVEDDWFEYLYNEMRDGQNNPGQVEFGQNPIAFISFNYDRIIEQKLFDASLNIYGANYKPEIVAQIQNIPILHVYGKIAELPYETSPQATEFVYEYGISTDTLNLLGTNPGKFSSRALDRIQIVNEERDKMNTTEKIQETVRQFPRIIFLGFGYHKENMEILGLPQSIGKDHRLYGTCYHMTTREINNQIISILTKPTVPSHHLNFGQGDYVEKKSRQFLRELL